MTEEEKRTIRYAQSCAKKYIREKKRFKTKIEKKALKVVERLKKGYFMEELNALNEDARKNALFAYRVFRLRVHRAENLCAAGLLLLLLSVLRIVI